MKNGFLDLKLNIAKYCLDESEKYISNRGILLKLFKSKLKFYGRPRYYCINDESETVGTY
jgi:hypothetical protein